MTGNFIKNCNWSFTLDTNEPQISINNRSMWRCVFVGGGRGRFYVVLLFEIRLTYANEWDRNTVISSLSATADWQAEWDSGPGGYLIHILSIYDNVFIFFCIFLLFLPPLSLPLLLLLPLYLGNVYAHFEKWAAATRQYWLYTYQSISWFYSIVIDNHLLWLTSLQYRLLFNSRFHCFALMDFKFCFFFFYNYNIDAVLFFWMC